MAGGQLAQGLPFPPRPHRHPVRRRPVRAAGSRLYRTGDVARRVAGTTETGISSILAVRIRRFSCAASGSNSVRSRPGCSPPGVVAAAARIVDMPVIGEQLIGYVVAADGAEPDVGAVRERAADLVPAYMVPATVLVVDALPLTANGKLDREALPVPEFGAATAGFTAPETAQRSSSPRRSPRSLRSA